MDATFSQPSSPTAGLANYSVEPGAKELYPSPDPGSRARKRIAALRLRLTRRGKKDFPMTKVTIEAMVGTLQKSVTGIIASGSPDQNDLLNKSFSEFQAAVVQELDNTLAKAAPAEEPLFKGMGAVGRVANLVGSLASNVDCIRRGYDSWQSSPPANADPASPEVVEMLEGLVAHAELVLRVAVNECVEPMEDGEDVPHGMRLVMVPLADGSGEAAVKTVLPDGLAKYATDPAVLEGAAIDLGFNLLDVAGADVQGLQKMLAGGGLAKDAGGDATGLAGGDPGLSVMPDDGQDEDPLDVLGRLLALAMIVIDNLKQQVEGASPNDPTGEDNGSNAAAAGGASDTMAGAGGGDAGASGGAGATATPDPTDPAQKSIPTGDLAKLAGAIDDGMLMKMLADRGIDIPALQKISTDYADLRAQHDELQKLSQQVLNLAEAPKAPLIAPGTVMKGAEDGLAKQQTTTEDLAKMSPESRSLHLIRNAHSNGGRPI